MTYYKQSLFKDIQIYNLGTQKSFSESIGVVELKMNS